MEKQKNFWDKNAGRYDCFMRKDAAAYEQMYELLRPVVRHKTVLELATGTGLIAKNIVNSAAHIEATDASPEMIAEAKRNKQTIPYKRYRLGRLFKSQCHQIRRKARVPCPNVRRIE